MEREHFYRGIIQSFEEGDEFALLLYYYFNSSDKNNELGLTYKDIKIDTDTLGGFIAGTVHIGNIEITLSHFSELNEHCTCRPDDLGFISEIGCCGVDCDWWKPILTIERDGEQDTFSWTGTQKEFFNTRKLFLDALKIEKVA